MEDACLSRTLFFLLCRAPQCTLLWTCVADLQVLLLLLMKSKIYTKQLAMFFFFWSRIIHKLQHGKPSKTWQWRKTKICISKLTVRGDTVQFKYSNVGKIQFVVTLQQSGTLYPVSMLIVPLNCYETSSINNWWLCTSPISPSLALSVLPTQSAAGKDIQGHYTCIYIWTLQTYF